MSDRIHELLHRNLQEVFGEGDAARRRAPIDELRTRTSSTRRTGSHRPFITLAVWLGAPDRAARRPTTRAWM
jgi:hypothetical protein